MSMSRTFEEMGSVRTLDIDLRPRHLSASIASLESRGKRSLRRPRSLIFQTSQDQPWEQYQVRNGNTIEATSESVWGARESNSRLRGASVSLPASPYTYHNDVDEDALWDSSQAPAQVPWSEKSSRLFEHAVAINEASTTPRGIGGGMVIPMRDSSMRHGHAKNKTHHKWRSHPPKNNIAQKGNESEVGEESVVVAGSEEVAKLPEEEVDEVTKRINELKELKKRRDCSPTIDMMAPPRAVDKPISEVDLGPTPISRSPSRHLSVSGESRAVQAGEFEPSDIVRDEATAPSSPILQRQDRESGSPISLTTFKIRTKQVSSSPTATAHEVQSTPPQRSNSRLRRMVRPTGATAAEESKRTFSKRFSQPMHVLEVEERPTSADSIDDAVEEYLSSPRLTQRIHHPQTGRVISFSDVGDPTGSVVFCCVGMGLTRYITAFYDELAATLKLRLITPDRPGVGESEMYADGSDTPLSWPGKMKSWTLSLPRY